MRFGLLRFRSPLLSESFVYFLFLRVIRWFSSPGSPRTTIDSSYDNAILLALSFLIRTSAVIRSFAAHRGFSQLVTSFFGAMYQGILPTLFVAYSYLVATSLPRLAFRQYSLALLKIQDSRSISLTWLFVFVYF